MAAGTEIDRLFVKIEGDISGLRTSVGKAIGEVDRAEKSIGGKLTELAKRFPQVSTAALAVAGATAAVAAAAVAAGRSAVKYAADLGDQAEALGLNAERLQELRFAAAQNGVAQEEMDRTLMRLNLTVGDAVRNGGAAADKFAKYGISLTDVEGRTRSTDEVLGDLADRLSKIESPVERTAAAAEILGDKLGPRLQAMLSIGSDGLDQLRDAARRAGAVMDEETIKKAGQAQDQLDALAMVTKAQLSMALVDLAPLLVGTAQLIADVASAASKTAIAFKAMAGANPFGELDDAIQATRDRMTQIETMARRVSPMEDSPFIWRKLGYESRQEALADLERLRGVLEQQKQAFLDQEAQKAPQAAPRASAAAAAPGTDPYVDSWRARVDAQEDAETEIEEFNNARIERESKERAQRQLDDEAYMASWQERVLAQQEAEEEIGEFNDAQLEEERVRNEEYIALWWDRVEQQMDAEAELTHFQRQEMQMRYAAAQNALGNLSSLMASHSRKAFELGKVAAIAETIVSTYKAAQDAFAWGVKIGGPPLGFAFAATAVAAGVARVQAISRTSFGNRSVSVGVGNNLAVSSPAGGDGGGPSRTHYVSGIDPHKLYDGRTLIDIISEAQGDGAILKVVS